MCGISGFINLNGYTVDKRILKTINDTLVHRGPDDEGYFIHNNVGLAARRLSIIDLTSGHQPISNENGSIWITFNGEIYNYPDLRLRLIDKGHRLRSKSDTEVIVHLYEEYGMDFIQHLNGMFAFVIYDIKKQKIIAARDRLGEKPLYYAVFDNTFIFGSELKAILKHPKTKRKIDLDSLNRYLSLEYIPSPYSIINGVKKLSPAAILELDLVTKKINTFKYWQVTFTNKPICSLEEYSYDLDRRIYDAVKTRMISDVPIGVFLSGGIDSSTISYYMTKISPGKVKSFSIGFSDSSFDESKYARKVAKFLGTEHREKILEPKRTLELIDKLPLILDEPMADSSILPTYLLSDFTSKYVKVALGGDGGDELFMGYPTFIAHKLFLAYQKTPEQIRDILSYVVNILPVSFNNFSIDFMLKKFVSSKSLNPIVRNNEWLGAFFGERLNMLLQKDVKIELSDRKELNKFRDYFRKIQFSYLTGYLPNDILVKTDRASMFASLETRAPFLDYNLVEFINNIPSKYKLNRFTSKYILKKTMEKRLPKDIVYRKKKGFGIPLSKWLIKDLKPLTDEYFSYKSLSKEGLFNPSFVSKLLSNHAKGKIDCRKQLWTLLVFEIWRKKWNAEI